MSVVLYFQNAPDHPFGGPITSSARVRALDPFAWHPPHIVVDEWRTNWDDTHFVLDGRATPIPAEIIAARELAMARVRLRVRRDELLREVIDPIATNPLRWDPLTEDQKSAVMACRAALLAWPESEPDPMNPTPPALPEI